MFWENIKEAFTSILSNKMRSLLTMLGIIIGISSVIIITTIGGSIQSTLTATLNSLGGNTVTAYVQARYPDDDDEDAWATWEYPDMTESDYVTQEMIDGLVEQYPDEVKGVAAQNYLGNGKITDEADSDNYANVTMNGITPEYLDYMKLKISAGRSLTKADDVGQKRVCLIADTMAKRYFGDKSPIGEQLSVVSSDGGIYDFSVVGVYEYNQALFGKVDTTVPEKDRVTDMMIPIQTSFKLQGSEQTGYENFNLLLTPLADIEQATSDITSYFDAIYANNEKFTVMTYNMQSDLGMINTVLNVITIAVSGIAAISLIVGGVGVMNIMLVSITERTREIGVRMALGAKRRTIKMQFVIEAIVLCLIGGIIGILLGVGVGALLGMAAGFVIQNMYAEYSSYIILSVHPSVQAIMLSLFFSMLTGVFFGYYPANKAAKMEVIDALRYE
jgi:putative ABC transport system permease protein